VDKKALVTITDGEEEQTYEFKGVVGVGMEEGKGHSIPRTIVHGDITMWEAAWAFICLGNMMYNIFMSKGGAEGGGHPEETGE